jgi:hypothetical protein
MHWDEDHRDTSSPDFGWTKEAIDVRKGDYRVYIGIVDQDVRGDDGRLAIPRGSNVELIVRFARDNDMILDLDSVTANGQRYGVKTERFSQSDPAPKCPALLC